jgi:hypothetical protein
MIRLMGVLDPFRFVLISIAGWMNQQQQEAIDYLREENKLLVQSNYSCGTGIIPEQASQTLPALNAIARATSVGRLGEQQDVCFPLMRAFGMKMRNVLVESAA